MTFYDSKEGALYENFDPITGRMTKNRVEYIDTGKAPGETPHHMHPKHFIEIAEGIQSAVQRVNALREAQFSLNLSESKLSGGDAFWAIDRSDKHPKARRGYSSFGFVSTLNTSGKNGVREWVERELMEASKVEGL